MYMRFIGSFFLVKSIMQRGDICKKVANVRDFCNNISGQ